jgi:hypothetical protein
MERIGPVGSARTGRVEAIRPVAAVAEEQAAPSRALTLIEGGRSGGTRSAASLRDGRSEAGFVAQLLVGADPTLQPSRSVRTQHAANRYAEMARLLA